MKAPQRPVRIELAAPLSGVMVPLENVPDPVFAQKMVGDGVSIDPTSDELLAPLSGKVTQLHRANHAVTITGDNGLEVLLHIGLDTVMLRGEGFTPLVKEGDIVATGQPLIRFDPLVVGAKAVSLLTQMVIANGDLVTRYVPATGLVTAGKDAALSVELVGGAPEEETGGTAGAIFVRRSHPAESRGPACAARRGLRRRSEEVQVRDPPAARQRQRERQVGRVAHGARDEVRRQGPRPGCRPRRGRSRRRDRASARRRFGREARRRARTRARPLRLPHRPSPPRARRPPTPTN